MKKRKKRNRIVEGLKLLHPRNLENEVHVYGYHFSWKSHILLILCSLLGISAIGILFHLKAFYFSTVIVAVGIMLPVFILDMYKRMFEQKRFTDAVTYAEQILYSFQKNGKVLAALKETRGIFEDGRMWNAISDAIDYLEAGQVASPAGLLREALELIEKPYACEKLHMVHELLISSEEYGGDMNQSILLILSDIELWKRRGYRLQADKKKSHTDNIISIVVATILCAVALYVLDSMGKMFPGVEGVDIFAVGIIQLSSFGFILFMLYVLTKSLRSLTDNWLQSEKLHDEKYILASYDKVMAYDEAGGKKKGVICAAPFFVGAVVAFCFEKNWLAVICILFAVFMLLQSRLGYNLAKKDVNKAMYIALPQWLMEIALLLQTNNVQVSIAKSIDEAPPVLRRELEQLMRRLQDAPDQLHSYIDFCKGFDLPEVQSCMKMLHAMSESGVGNAGIQINNLIQRVNEMQNMADNIQSENIAFRMRMIFAYPILGATAKLLIDLTVGMLYMFQLLGSMGGM